jgi:DNA-binding response OmpR family regulator
MIAPRILLIEDEAEVRMVVADLLRDAGYTVEESEDAEQAIPRLSDGFDLLVIDVMLPGMDGFAFCRLARQRGFDGAVLMLTARTRLEDRVGGLETGADDYLGKPFDAPELLARVKALLRRVQKEELTPVMHFRFADVEVDFVRNAVTRGGAKLSLAAKELQLLRFLINHRGQVVSRDEVLKRVWSQQPYITPRTVDTHIAWLRHKLESDPANPKHILTVRGEGYLFKR